MKKSVLQYFKRLTKIVSKKRILRFMKVRWNNIDVGIIKCFSGFYTRAFHKLYYYSGLRTWQNTHWLGIPALKYPLDLWIYQEIIYKNKPEVIIETGTANGGSALFFASICDLTKRGKIVTIDIANSKVFHPRITKIIGDSVSEEVINKVKKIVGNRTAMVVLNSDHRKNHVLRELELYSEFVSIGNYLIVEDTNINGHPVLPGFGDGPMEAVREFLKKEKSFKVDRNKEKFFLTSSPKGFLKKVR